MSVVGPLRRKEATRASKKSIKRMVEQIHALTDPNGDMASLARYRLEQLFHLDHRRLLDTAPPGF
jgi:hypothetical protein